jgi:hypothetical protein
MPTHYTDESPTSDLWLELLEVCWRMQTPSGTIVSCDIYRTPTGLDVRAGYDGAPLMTLGLPDLVTARQVADVWGERMLGSGHFINVPRG